eukprot:5629613-Pleurochrysis_carterae.AAC.3
MLTPTDGSTLVKVCQEWMRRMNKFFKWSDTPSFQPAKDPNSRMRRYWSSTELLSSFLPVLPLRTATSALERNRDQPRLQVGCVRALRVLCAQRTQRSFMNAEVEREEVEDAEGKKEEEEGGEKE